MLLRQLCRQILNSKAPRFHCSTLQSLLSPHTFSILSSSPQTYLACKEQMQEIASLALEDKEKKRRLNIAFSVSTLPDVYDDLKGGLYQLIKSGELKSQSDLDRLTKWLSVELRHNGNVSQEEVRRRLGSRNSLTQLRERLEEEKQKHGNEADVSLLSKKMRVEFPALESKLIYQEILATFTNRQNKESKQIWDKLGDLKPRLLQDQTNSPQITKHHIQLTGGRLRFRFPPEPNGYLHIGHAKSIRINFETAKQKNGLCFLRFDDTNPEKQSQEFIQNIIQEVRWLGYQPDKITFASDYFEQLMEYGHQLIRQGDAYVCSTPREAISEERKNKVYNPYRDRDREYSIKRFPNLGQDQVLRLKLDPEASNPTLRDPIIYRLKHSPHPRTGTKYRIYPTYDFAHCICDSLQHIDYSLCSLEFQIRRQLYYKILDLLKLYKPTVWEYSRLNIEGTLLSKRKITKLVEERQVDGWEDPRLMTLAGLRNRGYSPKMILNFVDKVNASRAGNENVIQSNVLLQEMRKEMFESAERTMAVLDPVQVTILNLEGQLVEAPLFPSDPSKGHRQIKLSNRVYIERDEGVRVGKVIGLKYLCAIRITKVGEQLEGEVVSPSSLEKPRYIHWVPHTSTPTPVTQFFPITARDQKGQQTYNPFNTKIYNARLPHDLDKSKVYQFERIGYFRWVEGRWICCCRL